MWLADTALSYSHQPERVKVRVTAWRWAVFMSISKVTVNSAPISGSTPSRAKTRVSVAASLVPSSGRRPSAGVQK